MGHPLVSVPNTHPCRVGGYRKTRARTNERCDSPTIHRARVVVVVVVVVERVRVRASPSVARECGAARLTSGKPAQRTKYLRVTFISL